jgi:hypothetical protein
LLSILIFVFKERNFYGLNASASQLNQNKTLSLIPISGYLLLNSEFQTDAYAQSVEFNVIQPGQVYFQVIKKLNKETDSQWSSKRININNFNNKL